MVFLPQSRRSTLVQSGGPARGMIESRTRGIPDSCRTSLLCVRLDVHRGHRDDGVSGWL